MTAPVYIAKTVLTYIIVWNAFAWYHHPIEPTEVTIWATDSNLEEFFLEFPEVVFGSYYPGGGVGIDQTYTSIRGLEISEILDILEQELDVCVVTTLVREEGDYNTSPIRFTGTSPVDSIAKATLLIPEYPNVRPQHIYIDTPRPYNGAGVNDMSLSIEAFNITLVTADC